MQGGERAAYSVAGKPAVSQECREQGTESGSAGLGCRAAEQCWPVGAEETEELENQAGHTRNEMEKGATPTVGRHREKSNVKCLWHRLELTLD